MTPEQMYPFRLFGVAMTAFILLCGLAVVLRPKHKIVSPGHRIGNFIIWMLGEKNGLRIIRLCGWVMVIGGAVGLISVLSALLSAR
ncbi:MAG: hypothetical protein NZM18_04915 [Thermoflexales bacterium]|nr:hypothetical protein [Thermoflexales bacterium]MDW8351453.1 hypothetical protein [Anaerolineae bacterium]